MSRQLSAERVRELTAAMGPQRIPATKTPLPSVVAAPAHKDDLSFAMTMTIPAAYLPLVRAECVILKINREEYVRRVFRDWFQAHFDRLSR
jgi:hypothetical protein